MDKLAKIEEIKGLILELRGQKVMLDRDLAEIYGVSTKALNQAVRRNKERFPDDFVFRLTDEEKEEVVTICDHLNDLKFSYQLPYAFTRNGANMLSTVLKSPTAVYRSIQIMRAFSAIEETISKRKDVLSQSPQILKKLSIHSRAIMQLFQEIKIGSKKTDKIAEIQNEMIELLKKIVIWSMQYDKDN